MNDSIGPMPVVRPGEGLTLATAAPLALLCRAEWTGGDVCVLEQSVLPGSLSAAHTHTTETQGAYVIDGEVTFWTEGEEATLGAGGYVVRPAGAMHSIWNATDRPARMLEITTPAEKFERFVLEFDALLKSGDGGAAEIADLAGSYGTKFDADLTQELCSAHGVSTAGSAYAQREES